MSGNNAKSDKTILSSLRVFFSKNNYDISIQYVLTDYIFYFHWGTYIACRWIWLVICIGIWAGTDRVWEPSVWDIWSLLVYADHFLHVFKAWVTRHYIMEWGLVIFNNTCTISVDKTHLELPQKKMSSHYYQKLLHWLSNYMDNHWASIVPTVMCLYKIQLHQERQQCWLYIEYWSYYTKGSNRDPF